MFISKIPRFFGSLTLGKNGKAGQILNNSIIGRSERGVACSVVRCQDELSRTRPETAQSNNFLDIGNRNIFSEEHDMFRESVRKFFQDEVVPYHAQWEKDGQVSRELWEKAGAQGLLGVSTSDDFGGVGGDFLSSCVVHEEQSYCNCSGPGFALHSDIVMPYITRLGNPEQIARYIPPMTTGKIIGALAMTEPSAGGDVQRIKTTAKRDGDDWILNGSKVFITNGYMADLVIVAAVSNTDAKTPAHGMSLFLVDANAPGFTKGKPLEKIGLKAQDTCELFFDDVRLPASALLGQENYGFMYLMANLPQERLLVAVMGQANSEWMFEETRTYVKQRKAFGKTLSRLQTVQHKMAEMKTEICVGRAFIDNCIQIHSESELDSQQASMAKMWVSEMQNRIATQCLQLHGGWGYMWEYPIARAFVDARVQPIYAGANEIMKELIARNITAD